MENKLKIKLCLYLVFTGISFLILVPFYANLGITLFILLQVISLILLLPKSKKLLILIPIFLIGLSYTLSANEIWRPTNLVVMLTLLSIMTLLIKNEFNFKDGLFEFLKKTISNIFDPINHFEKPIVWGGEIIKDKEKKETLKKVLKGIVISIPLLILILILLSSADMIFSHTISRVMNKLFVLINISFYYRMLFSLFFGFYMFSVLYLVLTHKKEKKSLVKSEVKKEKDTLIFNIVLGMVLVVYSIFIIIQFRYLFTGGNLPFGLSYAEYARRGFFELLFLTGINIGLILLSAQFKHIRTTLSGKINNAFLYYLCTVTIILLASSFYRMYLYSNDYGLTRLRLYVFGFLIFEFIALLVTYFYIKKPKFNIVFIYSCLTMIYYILLNIIPTDYIIASNLINKYKTNNELNISYVMELSSDAAPAIEKLLNNKKYGPDAKDYFYDKSKSCSKKWQGLNISCVKVNQIRQTIK